MNAANKRAILSLRFITLGRTCGVDLYTIIPSEERTLQPYAWHSSLDTWNKKWEWDMGAEKKNGRRQSFRKERKSAWKK